MNKIGLMILIVLGFYQVTTYASVVQTVTAVNDTVTKKIKGRLVNGVMMNADNDLVQNISGDASLSIFNSEIAFAGLTETLKSKGPLTVFAPNNNAFKNIPANAMDTLFKAANKGEMTRMLTYYIVPGRLRSKDIARLISANKGEAVLTTLSGSKLKAKINGDRNIVLIDENGTESIISQFDMEQNNGILDVVTGLLAPKK